MRIRLRDTLARVLCGLFVLALLVLVAAVLNRPAGQPLLPAVLPMGFLAVVFAFLGWRFLEQARSALVIGGETMSRSGPTGWTLPRHQLARLELAEDARGHLLRVGVGTEAARRSPVARAISLAYWTEPQHRAPRTIVLRIRAEDVDRLRAALDQRR